MEQRCVKGKLAEQVLERDNYTCRYCGDTSGPFEIDHVYPYSLGGKTVIDNLVTACYKCNKIKSDSVGIWPSPLETPKSKKKNLYIFIGFLFLALCTGAITSRLSEMLFLSICAVFLIVSILFFFKGSVKKQESLDKKKREQGLDPARLASVRAYIEGKKSAGEKYTIREVAKACGIPSSSTASDYIKAVQS